MPQRQIVLDTETTGLDISQGHRIIEIGCVELIDRKLSENISTNTLTQDEKSIRVHLKSMEFQIVF